jgi:uncharacterized Zn finger protein
MRFDRGYFPKTKPKRVRGGIKAQTQRGGFGTQWWAKRWIAVLEALDLGARLARGRSYARSGQVLDIAIEPGLVRAKVQGSRARPYAVAIRVATLGKPAWRRVTERIVAEARFAAKLLAGEMPHEIEEAFEQVDASLFPTSVRELHTECSCPDWSNPCKHIAAVYYLLGEEFDRDPFLLFTLRGGAKSEMFADLSEAAPAAAAPVETAMLPADHDAFWRARESRDGPPMTPTSERKPSTQRTLPAFPFWRGSEPLGTFLARVDDAATGAVLPLLGFCRVTGLPEPGANRYS